jgi:hypothetical protein
VEEDDRGEGEREPRSARIGERESRRRKDEQLDGEAQRLGQLHTRLRRDERAPGDGGEKRSAHAEDDAQHAVAGLEAPVAECDKGRDLEGEPNDEEQPDEGVQGRESLFQRFSTSLATAGSPIEAAKLSAPAAKTFAPAGVS